MKINFNVTGTERKSLVAAISQELNLPAKYLGAPTFAYEVGGYTISKDGAMTGAGSIKNSANSELLKTLNAQGFIGEVADRGEDETSIAHAEEPINGESYPDIDQHHPGQYADPSVPLTEEMLKQAKEWEKEQTAFDDTQQTAEGLVIEFPKDGFTEAVIANLEKLVESKSALIKKAIGTESLTIEQTEETLRFPWFHPQGDAASIRAYTKFITALCTMAKEQKRITSTAKEVENEKYAFRCFLLRLSFIGDDFKAERKILLSKLSGNSSFKSGERQPAESEAADE